MKRIQRVALVIAGILTARAEADPLVDCDAQQLAAWIATVENYRHQYYNLGRTVIDDTEFDALAGYVDQLSGCYTSLSPPRGALSEEKSAGYTRELPMLSLHAVFNTQGVQAFINSVREAGATELLLQPKIDGLALEVRYRRGRLISAATRGDGYQGVDVTATVRNAALVPSRLPPDSPEWVTVRGEVYVPQRTYDRYGKHYQTARDMAAGALFSRQNEPRLLAGLRFYPVEWLEAPQQSDWEALTQLAAWGLEDATRVAQMATDLAAIEAYFDSRPWLSVLPVSTDGIVIKVLRRDLRAVIGASAQAPNWAMAWKYRLPAELTTVRAIHYEIGRTGKVTPVVEIDPVAFPGRTVTRVSGYSVPWLQRRGLAPGAKVTIRLAGSTTPVIGAVLPSAKQGTLPQPPAVYPGLCVTRVPLCHSRFLLQMERLISPSGLAVDLLTTPRLRHLVDSGALGQLSDLYRLRAADLEAEGVLPTEASNILQQIARSRTLPLERQLYALGIPGMGPMTTHQVASRWPRWSMLLEADESDWQQLLGKRGEALRRAMQQPELARQLAMLVPIWEAGR